MIVVITKSRIVSTTISIIVGLVVDNLLRTCSSINVTCIWSCCGIHEPLWLSSNITKGTKNNNTFWYDMDRWWGCSNQLSNLNHLVLQILEQYKINLQIRGLILVDQEVILNTCLATSQSLPHHVPFLLVYRQEEIVWCTHTFEQVLFMSWSCSTTDIINFQVICYRRHNFPKDLGVLPTSHYKFDMYSHSSKLRVLRAWNPFWEFGVTSILSNVKLT